MGTVTRLSVNLPADPPCPSGELACFAAMLADEGKTPDEVWAWDPHRWDPDLRDPATLLLAETLAWHLRVASPLEAHLCELGAAAVLAASAP